MEGDSLKPDAPLPTPGAPKPEHHPDLSADTKPSQKKAKMFKIVAIVLGGIAVVLLITVVILSTKASLNSKTIQAAVQKGESAGREAQKAEDEKNFTEQQNKDTRVFTAPDAYGAFQITLPKNYSLAVTPGAAGAMTGLADPDSIDTTAVEQALRLEIKTTPYDQVKKNYDNLVKDKRRGVTSQDVTVSGIQGTKYTGLIGLSGTGGTNPGTVVLLPVRDKTFILQTDNNQKFGTVFQQILDQIRITP